MVGINDPYSTLNPRMTVGEAVGEPMLFHKLATKAELPGRVAQLLGDVPARKANSENAPPMHHQHERNERHQIPVWCDLASETSRRSP